MRRRKQQISSQEEKEQALLSSLCQLLRKNSDKILKGDGKLSLTTESLSLLGGAIRCLSDNEGMGLAAAASPHNNSPKVVNWRRDVDFLRAFIAQAVAIKIMHGSNTMQGAIQINRFKSLKVLEVKKVPIHMIEGLQILRGQLTTIIINRSLHQMQDVFETCGGDMSAPMSWPQLRTASLSYNGIHALDGSLRLLPSLEVFDVSHNQLQKTDKNLEYLTELSRLNLGYNCLDSLPTFSISCKAKLKTLVIRSNNMDNIEGVGELTALQELDISDNLLSDHRCLRPLSHLNMLNRLSTQGNPIAHHKQHRHLTVGYLSATAVTTQFELDGKKLSTSDMSAARHQGHSSRRPSSIAHSVMTRAERSSREITDSSGNISSEYSYSETNTIATSLPVGSRRKGKRRSRRMKEITDMDSSATEASSPENSYVPPSPMETHLAEHVRTRHKVEMLRNHYGPNWLQVMDAQFSSDTGRSDASNSATSDNETSLEAHKTLPQTNHANWVAARGPTDDDLYLNEPVKSPEPVTSPEATKSPLSPESIYSRKVVNGDRSTEERVKSEGHSNSVASQSEIKVNSNHTRFDWTIGDDKIKKQPESANVDFPGFEWSRTESEEVQSYGEETEPFIVLFKQRNCEQMFVSLNQRYILEKNLNGAVIERLDLKSMLSFDQSEEPVVHEDVVDEVMMPHIKLTFNYVRKDRRERIYIMENMENAEKMCELLQPFLDENEKKLQPKFTYQCLKCSNKFSKQQGKAIQPNKPMPTAGSSKDFPSLNSQVSVLYQCLKCGSDHVILVETTNQSPSSSATSTPVGSYSGSSSGSFLSPMRDRQNSDFNPSPLAKSTPHKQQASTLVGTQERNNVRRNLYSNDKSANDRGLRPRSNAFLEETDTNLAKSDNENSEGLESQAESVTTPIENKAFRRDSWPTSGQVSHTRLTSQDSDITILTNPSEGSIAVISETSSETLSAITPIDDRQDIFYSDSNTRDEIVRSVSEPKQLNLQNDQSDFGEKTVTTPMGSPLSNSICTSLVTSVYQNSGLVEQRKDSNSNKIVVKEDEFSASIYDSGIDSSLPKDRLTQEESGSASDSDAINVIPVKEEDVSIEEEEEVIESRERSAAVSEHPFTDVNHQLKLHLMVTLFDDSEEFECILKCDCSQYLTEEVFKAIFIMTNSNFYIFKVALDDSSENVSDWLTTLDIQPIAELCHVDLGLGCQSFRLEFDTECSSYTFIVRDAERCTSFMDFLEELLEKNMSIVNKKMRAEFNHTPSQATMVDVQREVLTRRQKQNEEEQKLELYVMGYLVRGQNPRYPVSFILTNEAICLVKENHQWPQPRLQAPLDTNNTAKHFTVLERQPISNIATVEVYDMDKTRMKLSFFNEQTGLETTWQITMETTNGVQSLVDGIRHPWEEVFGVELDINMIPFSDSDSED